MSQSTFLGKSFISIDQIKSKKQLKELFSLADKMKICVENHKLCESLKGRSIAILFYQPSTRTFSSFVAAAKKLGAYVIAIHEMSNYSSAYKGESLEDTIRSIYQTVAADAIIIRHPDDNSSQIADDASPVPTINAGSGTLEHPTQALLDLYTIYNNLGRLGNLNVVMVGDMLYGRTTKSLAKLLTLFKGNKITFVSPDELKTPKKLLKKLSKKIKIKETNNLNSALKNADVVYMTRVQKEWFKKAGKMDEYEQLKHRFILTRHTVSQMKKKSIVMHPLPRVGEILNEVDNDPRAKYFSQMRSGLYIRMALLESILLKK